MNYHYLYNNKYSDITNIPIYLEIPYNKINNNFIKKIIYDANKIYNINLENCNISIENKKEILKKNEKIKTLGIHRDSEQYKLNLFTIIYYYDISDNIENNKLLFYKDNKEYKYDFINNQDLFGNFQQIEEYFIKDGDIITFPNNSYHKPSEYISLKENSKRFILVICIQQNE